MTAAHAGMARTTLTPDRLAEIEAWTAEVAASRRAYHRHMAWVAQQDGRARALDRAIEREARS